jgi:hypothetical protein
MFTDVSEETTALYLRGQRERQVSNEQDAGAQQYTKQSSPCLGYPPTIMMDAAGSYETSVKIYQSHPRRQ